MAAGSGRGAGRRFKVGFIGTGGRSVPYAKEYAACGAIDIVALADPSEEKRRAMVSAAGLAAPAASYTDFRDMLREHRDLDGVVICSPNHLHAEHAVPCLERGLPVVIEKPLAVTKEDCERIIDAERAHGARTLIGFVLRSAPFYLKIHELVRAGAVGQIVALEADELVRWLVTSLFMRGSWRRFQATSGGAMLEKCCHDLDLLNWLMGCRPVSLNSYGSRLTFCGNPALPAACKGCPAARACVYYYAPKGEPAEDAGERILHRFLEDEGSCVYNTDKDVADVQSVNIEYESGAVATFLLSFNCGGSHGGRNIRIVGQKGSIWGNINDMKVTHFDNRTEKETVHTITTDGSGHGGGDRRHALELLEMMKDPAYRPGQNAQAGYLSAAMCLACDISRLERRRVNFRYKANGYVDFA